ncbi:MAG: hypothetical protein JWO48_2666, partial [Bryobacterales bacterium]|nr:hypothetical protein [Bryobacterales bacterium]
CQSHFGGVEVARSDRLADIGNNKWARVWSPPSNTSYSRGIWAPELHYLRGKWYIYVAADDGHNEHHRIYVLEGASQDPQQPFIFKGQLKTPGDRWSIDGTVAQFPGDRLYFIWSGWEGSENTSQNLYIAPMIDPCTLGPDRTCISRPMLAWERHGYPLINEGPEALWHDDQLFIIYSASGAWTDDYCLGQLRWTGGDPMKSESWVKRCDPVLSRTADVQGPGHCCFVKSRDGREDWILYHSNKYAGVPWKRQINMQRFTWNADGSPYFGRPISPGVEFPEPSGDATAGFNPSKN